MAGSGSMALASLLTCVSKSYSNIQTPADAVPRARKEPAASVANFVTLCSLVVVLAARVSQDCKEQKPWRQTLEPCVVCEVEMRVADQQQLAGILCQDELIM